MITEVEKEENKAPRIRETKADLQKEIDALRKMLSQADDRNNNLTTELVKAQNDLDRFKGLFRKHLIEQSERSSEVLTMIARMPIGALPPHMIAESN